MPKEYFGEGADADVQTALQSVINLLKVQGAETVEVSLPQTSLSIPAYYVLASAEASTNLSRFDGVRYGHRAVQFGDLEEMYSNTRAEGFGSEVKRRIMIGTYVLSHGYYDAYYLKAQKLRRLVANDFRRPLVNVISFWRRLRRLPRQNSAATFTTLCKCTYPIFTPSP